MDLDEAIRKFKEYVEGNNDFDELDFKEAIKQLIEEEKIKELGNLLSKKDEFIPDLTFKKIKDRIKELENK